MIDPVLLDTNVIYAALNRRDHDHDCCVAVLNRIRRPLVTCEAVICEACFLAQGQPMAVERILANVARRVFQIPLRLADSGTVVLELMRKYADTPASFADACLIAMANELGTGDILTLDSDFKHYRWRRNRAFNLLIPLD
ncbi:MAG: PIN domain-containing protein [Terracidiphilus sp.]